MFWSNSKKNFLLFFLLSMFSTIKGQKMNKTEIATIGGWCFWCIEASFEQIEGVIEAISGYVGGTKNNAQYDLVSSG